MYMAGFAMVATGAFLIVYGLVFTGILTYLGDLPEHIHSSGSGLLFLLPIAVSLAVSVAVSGIFWLIAWLF